MIDGSSSAGATLRGMILAAGYGTRLAPVTDHVPKPLLPVGGRALLDLIIGGVANAGIREIGINTHHLGSQITAHVAAREDRDRITLFAEADILGTGGALYGARDFLAGADHFLLHNGDVLCDADLPALVAHHRRSGALATLLLTDWPAVNSVVLVGDGRIASIAGQPATGSAAGHRNLTYTGIGVFSRRILEDIGPGFSSLVDPLVRAITADPQSVRGFAPDGFDWSDLGTIARYLAVQPEAGRDAGTRELGLERITGHGSDRKFWRLCTDDWSSVAMVSPPGDQEFDRFVRVARFLGEHRLGAPELLSTSLEENSVLMEDLGSRSLYTLVRDRGFESRDCTDAYRMAVDRLAGLQTLTAAAADECPWAVDRVLDHDALRWETDYFRERFLAGHLRLDPGDLAGLDDDFNALATVVSRQPRVLIHRDFQSQNILLQDGAIKLVDFQGMRLGPLTYDLASLVFDPYVAMPTDFRTELVERFAAGYEGRESPEDIRAMVLAAGLQRVMQALGAYGFLGHVKGKRDFLAHIPAGLAVLREVLGELGEAGPWLPGSLAALERYLESGE